jgi:hypothetical protein
MKGVASGNGPGWVMNLMNLVGLIAVAAVRLGGSPAHWRRFPQR